MKCRKLWHFVITGAETEFCVLGSLMDAVDEGCYVTLVSDGAAGEEKWLHDAVMAICRRMPSRLK
jgi:nicotinamidase-related amidase